MTDLEAMKMALDALEFDGFSPQDLYHRQLVARAAEALRTRLAQPEQEPVAWGVKAINTKRICTVTLSREEIFDINPAYVVPLYTAPQQRECKICGKVAKP